MRAAEEGDERRVRLCVCAHACMCTTYTPTSEFVCVNRTFVCGLRARSCTYAVCVRVRRCACWADRARFSPGPARLAPTVPLFSTDDGIISTYIFLYI